jgi:hypothetical protein
MSFDKEIAEMLLLLSVFEKHKDQLDVQELERINKKS